MSLQFAALGIESCCESLCRVHRYDARHNGEVYVVGETVACKECGTELTVQVQSPTLVCTADGCKCVNIVSRQRPAVPPSRKAPHDPCRDRCVGVAAVHVLRDPKSLPYGLPSSLDKLRDYIRDTA